MKSGNKIVYVGKIELDNDDVRLLHLLVTVDKDWTLVLLSKEMSSRYDGDWYRQRCSRIIDNLRRHSLIEKDGYGAISESVAVIAQLRFANPSTGKLWREMARVISDADNDVLSYLKKNLEEAGLL